MSAQRFIETILNGGVVLCPTDTVYGLAAKPDIKDAVDKIYSLKLRPRDKNLPIMVSKNSLIASLGLDVNNSAYILLNSELVPGPITLVLGFSTIMRPFWLNGREEVAVRIPNHELMLEVLGETGPLLVTSANIHSSNSTPNNVKDILNELNGLPDLILDEGILNEVPSTIINCRKLPYTIERIGVVPTEIIHTYLGI